VQCTRGMTCEMCNRIVRKPQNCSNQQNQHYHVLSLILTAHDLAQGDHEAWTGSLAYHLLCSQQLPQTQVGAHGGQVSSSRIKFAA
jgi:hypothetical protein